MNLFRRPKQLPRLLACIGISAGLCLLGGCRMVEMPGKSHKGPVPPLTAEERELVPHLKRHVEMLAARIGERNMSHYRQLQQAADYVSENFRAYGYTVREDSYQVDGKQVVNIEVELKGSQRPEEIVVVGAHYDSTIGSPGANDNASGVAALLELAQRFSTITPERTIRFVAFTNEEPPWFLTDLMGSRVYTASARKRGDRIIAMMSLETIGYYTDTPKSQHYPQPFSMFYPDRGNFIGFVCNLASRSLLHTCIGTFRKTTLFPSEGLAAPEFIQGIGWSDQWSFWQEGYPGIMITDTAPFRYPHYHEPSDTPDKLQYEPMAKVVTGLGKVLESLAR